MRGMIRRLSFLLTLAVLLAVSSCAQTTAPVATPTPAPPKVSTPAPQPPTPSTQDRLRQAVEAKNHVIIGNIHLQREEWDMAIIEFDYAIDVNADYAPAYAGRAEAYSQKRRYDLAFADAEKAMRLDHQTDLATVVGNAYVYRCQNEAPVVRLGAIILRDDSTIIDCSKAIAFSPKNAFVYRFRGSGYDRDKEYDLAIADYTTAIKIAGRSLVSYPELNHLYYYRGRAYLEKGEYSLAVADFTNDIQIDPWDPNSRRFRGFGYCELGEHDKAISDFTEAIRLYSIDVDAYVGRAFAYVIKGENDKAIADYAKAVELDPKIGLTDKALSDYEKFLSLSRDEERNQLVRERIKALQLRPTPPP